MRLQSRSMPFMLLLAWAAACNGDKWGSGSGIDSGSGDDDDDGGITLGDSGAAECSGTAPEIVGGPWCDYPGKDAPEPGGTEQPTIRIYANVHDDDGDLHIRAVRMWFDGAPLGEIDQDTAEFKEKDRLVGSNHDCQVFDTEIGDRWYLIEGRVEWEAEYDWGIAVQDAEGNWSDMEVVTCPAPTEEGEEP